MSNRLRSFPSRHPQQAVSPVVSTILLVAITVALASVLFVLVSASFGPKPPTPISITFTSQNWDRDNGSNAAGILKAVGVGDIPLGSVLFTVIASNNDPYFDGHSGDWKNTSGANVSLVYTDLDNNSRISAGDQIVIAVTPTVGYQLLEGGVMQMFYEGREIARHSI